MQGLHASISVERTSYAGGGSPRRFAPTKEPTEIADGILAMPPQSVEGIRDRASALQASLDILPGEMNRTDDKWTQDFRKIQQSIDVLSEAVQDLRLGTSGGQRQGGQVGGREGDARLAVGKTQEAFDRVIKDSAGTARLSGNALKHFMKTIYPEPNQLIERAQHVLSLPQQSELIDASKRLQRLAGAAKRSDAGNFYEKMTRSLGKGKHPVADEVQQATLLGWSVTGLSDEKQKKRAIAKLQDVFPQALSKFAPEIEAAKADGATQYRAVEILHRVALLHEKGAIQLSVEQRFAVVQTLAAFCMGQIESAPKFRDMFMRFVDDEVRAYASAQLPKEPVKFSLKDNVLDLRHLQHGLGTVTRAANSTRAAQHLDIGGKTHYVKEIDHGPLAAISENAATQINALTGQPTPIIHLARFEETPRVIASQLVPGYKDIGAFVLDRERIAPLIEKEWGKGGLKKMDAAIGRAEEATRQLVALNDELAREMESPNADKGLDDKFALQRRPHRIKRLDARREIYAMLPAEIHRDIAKAQFLSRLVGNDDFVNFEFYNTGLTEQNVVVTLDLGNALLQGFGGKQRNSDNLERANRRARVDDPYPPNQVTVKDHRFDEDVGWSRTNVGGIPRSVPLAALLGESIGAETWIAETQAKKSSYEGTKSIPRYALTSVSGQLEGAFQLRFLPDEAIRAVVAKTWPTQLKGVDMPCTPEELADNLIARRDALVNEFTGDELKAWEEANPERARASYEAVAVAVAYQTGLYIPAYSPMGVAEGVAARLD